MVLKKYWLMFLFLLLISFQTTQAINSTRSVQAVQPVQPAQPVQPTPPTHPGQPVQPVHSTPPVQRTQPTTILKAIETSMTVHHKKAKVFDIVQENGMQGYSGQAGKYFDILLKNETHVPISIHWHGLILPNDQDGVPYVTQLPILPGKSQHYSFKLLQSGSYWMHSHFQFHEQELMTAPLILHDAEERLKAREVTIMLQGFTFKNPEKIFYDLQHQTSMQHMDRSMKPNQTSMQHMDRSMKPDLNDVQYDAYIANRRTLQDPEVVRVNPTEKVRLRLINGSSASNFWVDTGELAAQAIAIDGNAIKPIIGKRFQLAVAQRIDLLVTIPQTGGVFPILAQTEGIKQRTGVILATVNAKLTPLSEQAAVAAEALNDEQEYQLHALHPLVAKPVKQTLTYTLTGDMQRYIWKINHQVWPHISPAHIKKGDRIEMVFINDSNMAHPMHLHGHVFQVSEINGKKLINGPLRDTILVLPHTVKKIIFDANNPGIWMNHCHVLYHMAAGMMTTTNYVDYPEPDFYKRLISGEASGIGEH